MRHIITEFPYLRTLLTKSATDYFEVMEIINRMDFFKLDHEQYCRTLFINDGCDSRVHIIYYIPDRDYYVYLHDKIGSDYHCGNGITINGMLSSASVHVTYQSLIEELLPTLTEDINDRSLDSCDVDEFINQDLPELCSFKPAKVTIPEYKRTYTKPKPCPSSDRSQGQSQTQSGNMMYKMPYVVNTSFAVESVEPL